MGSFKIEGGQPLAGEIQPQGAKNEALQILCAVLLTSEPVLIHNIPEIIDVQKLIKLLQKLGVKVSSKGSNSYLFQADAVDLDYLSTDVFKEDGKGLRGSIMLVGPMLSRFGVGSIPRPGGDKLAAAVWTPILTVLSNWERSLNTIVRIISIPSERSDSRGLICFWTKLR